MAPAERVTGVRRLDLMAAGTLPALRRLGGRVPDDVARHAVRKGPNQE
jgi:hypothetical protein